MRTKGRRHALVPFQVPDPQPGKAGGGERRTLTELEIQSRVDFDVMESTIERGIVAALNGWREVKRRHIADLTSQIRKAENDPVRLARISAESRGAETLSKALRRVTQEAGTAALREAGEQGLDVREPDTSAVQAYLQKRAEAAALLLARSISETAARQALRMSSPNITPNSLAAQVRVHLESLSDAFLRESFNALMVGGVGTARRTVYGAQTKKARYLASAVLDRNTCSACRETDGKEFRSLLDVEAAFPFGGLASCRGRLRCRCTVVAVFDT